MLVSQRFANKHPEVRAMAKKQKANKIAEFYFDHDCTNSGRLSYRCLELSVTSEEDEFTDSELELIEQMVETLNEHFPHMA